MFKMEEAIDSFIRFLAIERGLSENYQLSTQRSLSEFARWCAARKKIHDPRAVTLPAISEYLADRKRAGLSASSIKLVVVALKIFFRFLVAQGKQVIYDAEHFFDGFTQDPAYALHCLRTAARAGAETVVCCDTNGGTLVDGVATVMAAVVAAMEREGVGVGIHCHDDAGCGVANSLAAVQQGATQVQGTAGGYGERCGNANLTSIFPNLQLKLGYECLTERQLA